MNIFALDLDARQAARWHSDVHVNKMLLESCQMLSTAHWVLGGSAPYKEAYKNHPCTVWARESLSNYRWLVELADELRIEYTKRSFIKKGIEKVHACSPVVQYMKDNVPKEMIDKGLTPFAIAIRDEIFERCHVKGDRIQTYRNYYLLDKRGGKHATWTLNKPEWWIDDVSKINF